MAEIDEWRSRYVTTRRHPLAVAAYAVVFVFGLLFVSGTLHDSMVFASISPLWRFLWEWELLSGGLGALIALMVRPRVFPHWPDLADVLRFEGIGSLVGGLGMFTYAVVLIDLLGFDSYSWTLMTLLGCGLVARGIQAIWESSKVERLGTLSDTAHEILAEAHRIHMDTTGGMSSPPEPRTPEDADHPWQEG